MASNRDICGEESLSLKVVCLKHNCDLEENEHYDEWFLGPDFSGFGCPERDKEWNAKIPNDLPNDEYFKRVEELEKTNCSEFWAVVHKDLPNVNIFDLINDAIKAHKKTEEIIRRELNRKE